MGTELIIQRINRLYSNEILEKMEFCTRNGVFVLQLDLHGLKKYEAKRLINSLIALCNGRFILELIHGYTHGTVLKEMIAAEITNTRITEKWSFAYNPGRTLLEIAEAC